MLRNILSVIVGLIVGFVVIYLIEMIGHTLYPPAVELDMQDKSTMQAYIENVPTAALLFVLLAYALGSLVAGFITILVSKSRNISLALISGIILLLLGVINLFMIPHPVWFWIASLIIYIPLAYLGGLIGKAITC